ncbi:MAG: sulfite exporter TauE/SafE family protein [Clostridia bacterium]|nr:sulfite exporter TauE/SafE family protein [Clostridia bacterium]
MCFLLSAVAGTGVGGGGLFLVYMTGSMGIPQITAQALNLFYFLAASVPSILTRFRTLPWRLAFLCIAGGVPGVLLGSMVRDLLDGDVLRKIFGGLLAASGLAVFFVREKERKPERGEFH